MAAAKGRVAACVAARVAARWRRRGGGGGVQVAHLVQVGHAQLVVLGIELEEDGVEAPASARVGRQRR